MKNLTQIYVNKKMTQIKVNKMTEKQICDFCQKKKKIIRLITRPIFRYRDVKCINTITSKQCKQCYGDNLESIKACSPEEIAQIKSCYLEEFVD